MYNLTAVLANDILGNSLGVTITGGLPDQADVMHEGGPLLGNGTLVYNPATTELSKADGTPAGAGPLHDPTAIMYVRTEDMMDPNDPTAGLNPGTPVEPLVLRANPGECLIVNLSNRLPDLVQATDNNGNPVFEQREENGEPMFDADGNPIMDPVMNSNMPDLAGYNTMLQMVVRDRARLGEGMLNQVQFNNNLVRPSAHVGLHPQMVEFDEQLDAFDGLQMALFAAPESHEAIFETTFNPRQRCAGR